MQADSPKVLMTLSPSQLRATQNEAEAEAEKREAPVPLVAGDCTLYTRGGFGYRRTLVRALSITTQRYAQYERALRVEYLEKGKRKRRAYMLSYDPGLVVLAGHDHPETPSPMTEPETVAGGLVVQSTRRTCFDEGWDTEFSAWLASYCQRSGAQLLGDYRGFPTGGR